jgi:hypothetical protein
MHRIASFIALMAMLSLASISALAQSGEKTKVKGIINSRTGDSLVVSTAQGNVTVILNDTTKTKDNKGLLGARTEKLAREVLIPGLKLEVDGTFDTRRQVVATNVTVDGDDLEMSQMIHAGLAPLAKHVASNTERIDALERRLAALEEKVSGASTPAPAPSQAPAPDPAAPPPSAAAAAPVPAPAAMPLSAASEALTSSVNKLWIGLGLMLLVVCWIGYVALSRGK